MPFVSPLAKGSLGSPMILKLINWAQTQTDRSTCRLQLLGFKASPVLLEQFLLLPKVWVGNTNTTKGL